MPFPTLGINAAGSELTMAASFCRSEGIGIEVTDFAFPWTLGSNLLRRAEVIAGGAASERETSKPRHPGRFTSSHREPG